MELIDFDFPPYYNYGSYDDYNYGSYNGTYVPKPVPDKPAVVPSPPPVPDNDDAKVGRHQNQAYWQLQSDIRAAGEGGWRSPWYTGTDSTVCQKPGAVLAHQRWLEARDAWTETGDLKYKQAVEDATDFDCPPEAGSITVPAARRVTQRMPLIASLLVPPLVMYIVLVVVFLVL